MKSALTYVFRPSPFPPPPLPPPPHPSGLSLLQVTDMPMSSLRDIVGFVPQEDTMHRELTVEENLSLNAAFRLPSSTTAAEKRAVVEATIMTLGLNDIRGSRIGDEEARGISGGQRKRVNIGMELVADPTVLFLDEPTSGLDSTSSRDVTRALHRVSRRGLTVILVLHQPSYEICKLYCGSLHRLSSFLLPRLSPPLFPYSLSAPNPNPDPESDTHTPTPRTHNLFTSPHHHDARSHTHAGEPA